MEAKFKLSEVKEFQHHHLFWSLNYSLHFGSIYNLWRAIRTTCTDICLCDPTA